MTSLPTPSPQPRTWRSDYVRYRRVERTPLAFASAFLSHPCSSLSACDRSCKRLPRDVIRTNDCFRMIVAALCVTCRGMEIRGKCVRVQATVTRQPFWYKIRFQSHRRPSPKVYRHQAIMRLLSTLLLLPLLVFAQERPDGLQGRFDYQSDVARLRKIVIESLYSHKDVFLRELVSNANDAIEKYRLVSLQEGVQMNDPLNITLKLIPSLNGAPGRIIISDTGIGMTSEELTKNLGTLAKSGTSDFIAKAEASKGKSGEDANLIGQFGLGFYSSFLVASDVYVASISPPTKENPEPVQHVFASGSDAASFDVYPDPRGNTLGGHGTEITLVLKDDATEYLSEHKIRDLITKHSAFSTAHPIYLLTHKTEEVPLTPEDEGYVAPEEEKPVEEEEETETKADSDEDEVIVEDSKPVEEKKEVKPQTKKVEVDHWDHLNNQPPLWMRDPKKVSEEEYNEFYRATYKDHNNPIAFNHFKGDTGSGTSFRALIFLPSQIDPDFWNSPKSVVENVRLFVKRVFITSDLGENALPKWISWLRAIIDADDLPLNVSRETLQSTKFLAQAKAVLVKRFIQLMTRISHEDPTKYARLMKNGYANILKLGALESKKDQKKLMGLVKYASNQREWVNLDEYVEKRKSGQKQIFYLTGVGQSPEDLGKSIFVEKLTARGYEVLLLNDPMDEILFSTVRMWGTYQLQDVAKEGLKFGDEDEDEEAEKIFLDQQKLMYEPLIDYLKEHAKDTVSSVIISNRLVTSPCAIVASTMGYSGNMEKLMQAQSKRESAENQMMAEWAKKQRTLEINPRSPLIEGLYFKVQQMNNFADEEEKARLEEELKEVASILIDGALVRSGFEVPDSNLFFSRVDRVLRRSLGVSETRKADDTVKPAPPVVEPEKEPESPVLPDLDAEEDLSKVEEETVEDIPIELNAQDWPDWRSQQQQVLQNVEDAVDGGAHAVRDEL